MRQDTHSSFVVPTLRPMSAPPFPATDAQGSGGTTDRRSWPPPLLRVHGHETCSAKASVHLADLAGTRRGEVESR
jgi:hypothetical protein